MEKTIQDKKDRVVTEITNVHPNSSRQLKAEMRAVAAKLGLSFGYVYQIVRSSGVAEQKKLERYRRIVEAFKNNISFADMEKTFEVSRVRLYNIAQQYKAVKSFTKQQLGDIEKRIKNGETIKAIAESYSANSKDIISVCRKNGIKTPKRLYSYRHRKGDVNWHDNKIDWNKTNSEISREVGVSRERVRQVRLSLNIPDSPDKWQSASIIKLRQKILQYRHIIDYYRLSAFQIKRVFMLRDSIYLIKRVCKALGIEYFDLDFPWHLVSWKLPNKDIGSLWGCASPHAERYRRKVGEATWNIQFGWEPQDPEYFKAYEAEKEKVYLWRTLGQRVKAGEIIKEAEPKTPNNIIDEQNKGQFVSRR